MLLLSSKEVSEVLLKHIKVMMGRENLEITHKPIDEISFRVIEVTPNINVPQVNRR